MDTPQKDGESELRVVPFDPDTYLGEDQTPVPYMKSELSEEIDPDVELLLKHLESMAYFINRSNNGNNTNTNVLHTVHMARKYLEKVQEKRESVVHLANEFRTLAAEAIQFQTRLSLTRVCNAARSMNDQVVPEFSHAIIEARWALEEAEEYQIDTKDIIQKHCPDIQKYIEIWRRSCEESLERFSLATRHV